MGMSEPWNVEWHLPNSLPDLVAEVCLMYFQQMDDCYSEVVDKMSIGTPALQKRRETLAVCGIGVTFWLKSDEK